MKCDMFPTKSAALSAIAAVSLCGLAACQDANSDDAASEKPAPPADSARTEPDKPSDAKRFEQVERKSDGEKPETPPGKPEPAGEKPEASVPFDPSEILLSPEQKQKAEWALIGKLLSEKDPTTLSPTQADVALSPASLVNALQALWWGTRAETALELAALFDVKPNGAKPEKPRPEKHKIKSDAPGKAEKATSLGGSVSLSLNSGLWFNEAFPVRDDYRNLLKTRGFGTAESINWSEADASIVRVNRWCAESTGGMIETLFQPGDIRPPVAFVLASVIAFKGSWDQAFDPKETRAGDFSLLNGEKIPAAYLTATRPSRFAGLEGGARMLELPFAGGHQKLVALLPAKEGAKPLRQLEKQVGEKMPAWLGQLRETEVAISLPKFDVTSATDPAAALQSLGVKRIFSDRQADFSGASDAGGLKLDVIRHQAVVSIDENGAEAAGASGASVTIKSFQQVPEFRAERPFLFFILSDDGDVLFAGRVAAPKGSGSVSAGI